MPPEPEMIRVVPDGMINVSPELMTVAAVPVIVHVEVPEFHEKPVPEHQVEFTVKLAA
jgi:hypothetical protein